MVGGGVPGRASSVRRQRPRSALAVDRRRARQRDLLVARRMLLTAGQGGTRCARAAAAGGLDGGLRREEGPEGGTRWAFRDGRRAAAAGGLNSTESLALLDCVTSRNAVNSVGPCSPSSSALERPRSRLSCARPARLACARSRDVRRLPQHIRPACASPLPSCEFLSSTVARAVHIQPGCYTRAYTSPYQAPRYARTVTAPPRAHGAADAPYSGLPTRLQTKSRTRFCSWPPSPSICSGVWSSRLGCGREARDGSGGAGSAIASAEKAGGERTPARAINHRSERYSEATSTGVASRALPDEEEGGRTHAIPVGARLDQHDGRRPEPALERQMEGRVACSDARRDCKGSAVFWDALPRATRCALGGSTRAVSLRDAVAQTRGRGRRTHPILRVEPRALAVLAAG